jgi:hypothetical protein
MKVLGFLAALLAAGSSLAATIHGTYGSLNFPETVPPATLTWQIATESDQRVGLTITGILPNQFGDQRQWSIKESDASLYGIDWDAFEAAANNPAFNRSILTFGGVVKEGPVVRDFAFGTFRLDSFGVIVDDYVYPADRLGFTLLPIVNAGAAMTPIIPEPNLFALFVSASGIVGFRFRCRP